MTSKEENKLLRDNEKFIWSRVHRYSKWGVDIDDLFQEACIGFLKALRNWREDGGASLRTYARARVDLYIRRAIGTDHKGKMSPEPEGASLDDPGRGDCPLYETLSRDEPSPEDLYEAAEKRSKITRALKVLSPREVAVLQGRFVRDLTLKDAGNALGVGRERARQIESDALVSLGKAMRHDFS